MKGYTIKIELTNLQTGDKAIVDSTFMGRQNEVYNGLVSQGLKQLKETIETAEMQAIKRGQTL